MIYQYIEPILIKLNKTSIESLGVLYQCAHTQVETRNLPEFGKLKSRSPVLIKSLSTTIYPRLFLQTSTNAMSDNEKSQESI